MIWIMIYDVGGGLQSLFNLLALTDSLFGYEFISGGLYGCQLVTGAKTKYCRSDNFREVLFFGNFARRVNSRMQESRENYHYNSATKEK